MPDQAEPARQSFLQWVFMALGVKYTLLLPLFGLLAFLLTAVVVVRGRGSVAGAALLFIVPLPFWVGLYAAVEGAMQAYQVIASTVIEPRLTELAQGFSMSLASLWVGLLMMAPSYAAAMLGLFIRSLLGEGRSQSPPGLASSGSRPAVTGGP